MRLRIFSQNDDSNYPFNQLAKLELETPQLLFNYQETRQNVGIWPTIGIDK